MADQAHDLGAERRLRAVEKQLADGGPPKDNDGMEARIKALEDAVKDLPTKADLNEVRLSVKSDVLAAENGIIKWMVGTAVALGAAAITVMTFVLNNAAPKSAPAPVAQPAPAQQAPIIITVPSNTAPSKQQP